MSSTEHILLIILMLMSKIVHSHKIYGYFESLDCQHYDVTYAEILKCWLGPDQNDQLMMNIELKLKKDLINLSAKFKFIVDLNDKNTTYISMDLDICDLLGNAMRNPVIRLSLDEFRRKSNLPLACPLKKDIEYTIYNFTINSKLIPPFAPRLKWISDWNFYTKTNTATVKLLHYTSAGRVEHTKP